MTLEEKKAAASAWFRDLRGRIRAEFEAIEREMGGDAVFTVKPWEREQGGLPTPERSPGSAQAGGGEISIMKGRVFEKVGVNISTVHGEFSEAFRKEIPGADKDPRFWASGISLVAHIASPLVPAVHMNTRFIVVGEQKHWFGGGADLNPMYPDEKDTADFHAAFQSACDAADPAYYDKFKKWCEEYFWIKHRNESRGVGGIFYDYVESGDWNADFAFTQSVGETFLRIYPELVRRHMRREWTAEQREWQLVKRGRYAEFNLLYDRGTRFGLMTGGNPEAILMSLPPIAKWE